MPARAPLAIPPRRPRPVETPPADPVVASVRASAPAASAIARPDYRTGRVQVGAWVPEEAKRQLDVWAAQNGRTRQWVMEEALNLFFAREGLHRIARAKGE